MQEHQRSAESAYEGLYSDPGPVCRLEVLHNHFCASQLQVVQFRMYSRTAVQIVCTYKDSV